MKWAKLEYGVRGVATSSIVLFLSLFICVHSQSGKEIPYTLDDRDRLIRVEEQVQSLRNEMQSLRNEMYALRNELLSRFDAANTKSEISLGVLGINTSLLALVIGFLLPYLKRYTRKIIKPVREKSDALSENYQSLIKALREYAQRNPELQEILKSHGVI